MMEQVKEYEGIYSVTRDGRVFSHRANKFLSPINRTEYLAVKLSNEGKPKWHYIHRLVADAFCEKPFGKHTVNHIDGNHHNNVCENLEWVTMSENNQAAWDNGQRIMTDRMIEAMMHNLALGRTQRGQVALPR